MRILALFLLLTSLAFANYSLYYGELKLGVIKDFSTIHENYLKIKVTNPIARMLLGKKTLVYYNDQYTGDTKNKKIKYKRDRYHVIKIIQESISNRLMQGNIYVNEKKYIQIYKKEGFHFKYISKGKTKSHGDINVDNSTLVSLIDHKNHIKIIKN